MNIPILRGVWSEEARPQSFEEIILPARLKRAFEKFVKDKDMPNLLLVSNMPGTGKTAISQIITKELHTSCLFINGSDDNGIDTLRNEIKMFIDLPNVTGFYSDDVEMTNFKIIFIDEGDGLSNSFQKGLRGVMNDYDKNCRFIITCNYDSEILEPIIDRFTTIKFEFTHEEILEMSEQFYNRVCTILDHNNIKYESEVVANIIMNNAPRFRRIWDKLYEIYLTYDNEITREALNAEVEVDKLIETMNMMNYNAVMKVISDSKTINLTTIFPTLFRNFTKLTKFNIELLVYLLASYEERSVKCADKFLNFMGFYSELCMRAQGKL